MKKIWQPSQNFADTELKYRNIITLHMMLLTNGRKKNETAWR